MFKFFAKYIKVKKHKVKDSDLPSTEEYDSEDLFEVCKPKVDTKQKQKELMEFFQKKRVEPIYENLFKGDFPSESDNDDDDYTPSEEYDSEDDFVTEKIEEDEYVTEDDSDDEDYVPEEESDDETVLDLTEEERAFELLDSDEFEMDKVNVTNEGDKFIVLKRVHSGDCFVQSSKNHNTCPSYLLIKKNKSVFLGCYNGCQLKGRKLVFLGKI